jgi:Secretion system C-terminal sorting domain
MKYFLLFLLYTPTLLAQQVTRYDPPPAALTVYSLDADGDNLLAYAKNGIWLSPNKGASWQLYEGYTPPSFREWQRIEVENGIWYGIKSNSEVVISPDQGMSWQTIPSPEQFYPFTFLAAIGERIFVLQYGTIYYTTNFGNNWTAIKGEGLNLSPDYDFIAFKDKFYYRGYEGVFQINEQDSLIQFELPTPASTINELSANDKYLYLTYDRNKIIYTETTFFDFYQELPLNNVELPPYSFIHLEPDQNGFALALWVGLSESENKWYYSLSNGAYWAHITSIKDDVIFPEHSHFDQQQLSFIGQEHAFYENVSDNVPEGIVRNFSTNSIVKIAATEQTLLVEGDAAFIQKNSSVAPTNWETLPYTKFNQQSIIQIQDYLITLIDPDTDEKTQIATPFDPINDEFFISNQQIYIANNGQGEAELALVLAGSSSSRGLTELSGNYDDYRFFETDQALIITNNLGNEIHVFDGKYVFHGKGPFPCSLRLYLFDGTNLVQFCNNEGATITKNGGNGFSPQDWSTGTPLRFNRYNHTNYLNERYWLGVDGKGLYYAEDLSGRFYPYEVELPEKTPVAMSINYGKIWIAMRSGSIYSIQLPSVTQDNKDDFSLTVSPNPTPLGTFYLNSNLHITTDIQLRIIDVNGKVVSEQTRSGGDQWVMDMPELPQGMYWIQLKSDAVVKMVKWMKGL